MVTQRQLGVGVGAGAIGIGVGEGLQRAGERGIVTERQAAIAAGGVGGAALWAAVLGELGVIRLSDTQIISAAGFGLGEAGWFAGRRAGRLPVLRAELPDEINVAEQFVSSAVFTFIGAGAAVALGAIR